MSLQFLLFIIFFISPIYCVPIGLIYRPQLTSNPSPEKVVSALLKAKIGHLILINPTPATINCFSHTDISISISLSSHLIPLFSSDKYIAVNWVSEYILPFYTRVKFSVIAIGHGERDPDVIHALSNLIFACSFLHLPGIKISTVQSFSIIENPFSPSSARFQKAIMGNYIKPLLKQLQVSKSPFMIDISPYDVFLTNPNITFRFNMFENEESNYNGSLRYRNLFDEMIDAILTALAAAGHSDMELVITGVGWPTGGGDSASVQNASRFNRGLANHLTNGLGTPLRNGFGVKKVFIYELFDEPSKVTAYNWEKWFGIWYNNMTPKYEISF